MDILDHRHVASILKYLYDHNNVKKDDLRKIVKTISTLDRTLDLLKKRNLIEIKEMILGRRVYSISLTEEGRLLAEQLKRLEKSAPSGFFTEEQELLMYLAEKGEEDFDTLKSKFSGAYSAVKKLSEFGLVVQEARVEGLNTVNRIRVTEKGKNIGEKLIEAKEGLKT